MNRLINKVGDVAILPDGKKYVAVADPEDKTVCVCSTLCAGRNHACLFVNCFDCDFHLKLVEEPHDRD